MALTSQTMNSLRHFVALGAGDLPVARPYLHRAAQHRKTRIGVRTHSPSVSGV